MQRPRSTRSQRPAPVDYSGSGASSPPSNFATGASPLSRTDSTQRAESASADGQRSRSGSAVALVLSTANGGSPGPAPVSAQGAGQRSRIDASPRRVSDTSSPAASNAVDLHEQMQQLAQSAYQADQLNKRDKGKAVVRADADDPPPTAQTGQIDKDASSEDADELKRKQQIERVLKRAQAAKLARNFRNRIQLAAFKNQRGWQDVQLDVIEPHLEQEAQQRRLHAGQAASLASAGHATFGLPGVAGPSSSMHAPPPHQQHAMYQVPPHYAPSHTPSDLYRPQLGGGMEAVLAGSLARYDDDYASASAISMRQHHPPPPKRARVEHPVNSSYNVHSVYAAPPVPPSTHAGSPYATTQVYAPTLAGGSRYTQNIPPAPSARPGAQYEHGWDSRAVYAASNGHASVRPGRAESHTSNELYSLPVPAQQRVNNNSSPRTRSTSRRSPPKKQPLSSSDPTFSSFVDAANALTGMARAPSDPAVSGAGSQGGHSDEGAGPRQRVSMEMSASHSGNGGVLPPSHLSRHSSSSSSGVAQAPLRPSTPEQQVVKLPGAPNGGNNSAGDGATAEGAAELMLFLAASPSPVQARRTAPVPTLGDGMPKGRRLFSGTGDAGDTSFGGELDSFTSTAHATGNAPLSAKSSTTSSVRPPFATASPSADPSKHHFSAAAMTPSHSQQHSKAPPAPPLGVVSTTPATPGRRQRQPSLAGAWESFINASPSPKRQRKSRASGAAGGYPSENGDLPLGSEGGGGGIGGGPGNGQAQVTW